MKADLIKELRRNPLTIQTGQNITDEAADRIAKLEQVIRWATGEGLNDVLAHYRQEMKNEQTEISSRMYLAFVVH